jgi:hypothetical protein
MLEPGIGERVVAVADFVEKKFVRLGDRDATQLLGE